MTIGCQGIAKLCNLLLNTLCGCHLVICSIYRSAEWGFQDIVIQLFQVTKCVGHISSFVKIISEEIEIRPTHCVTWNSCITTS